MATNAGQPISQRPWVTTRQDTTWATLASNWTVGLFCPISPSPQKIKFQSTARAEVLTPPTSNDKRALWQAINQNLADGPRYCQRWKITMMNEQGRFAEGCKLVNEVPGMSPHEEKATGLRGEYGPVKRKKDK